MGDMMTKKMGRPRKDFPIEQFEKLCFMQCTRDEIADVFCCDEDTINNWCKRTYKKTFSAVFKEKRAGGKASLRRKQWLLADTSATMAIFLGKQYLGQRDERDVHLAGEIKASPFDALTEAELKKLAKLDDKEN